MQDNTIPYLLQCALMLMYLEEQVSIQALSQESVNSSVWLDCKQFKFHCATFFEQQQGKFSFIILANGNSFLKSSEYLHNKLLEAMKPVSVLKKTQAWGERGKSYVPSNKSSVELASRKAAQSTKLFVFYFCSVGSLSKVLHVINYVYQLMLVSRLISTLCLLSIVATEISR